MAMRTIDVPIGPDTRQVHEYIAQQGDDGATLDEVKTALELDHAEAARHLALLLMKHRVSTNGTMGSDQQGRRTNIYRAVEA